MRFDLAVAVAFSIPWALASCVGGGGGAAASMTDGEEAVRGEVRHYDPGSIPPEMWSPEQRRATASYYFLIGEFAGYYGQAKDALNLYQGAYNLDPNSYLGTKMAATKAAMGNFEGASAEAERLILLYPDNFRLRYLYGSLLASAGKVEEGIREFRKAIELRADFEPSYPPIIEYEIGSKNYLEACRLARQMTEKLPWSVTGWMQLTRCNLLLERKSEALAAAKTAYDMRSDSLEVAMLYATALEAGGDKDGALRVYEQMYFGNLVSDELLARIVELYNSMGDLNETLARLDQLIGASEQPSPGIEIHKGLVLEELKRYEEALRIYEKLMAARPEDDRLKFLAGRAQEKLRRPQQALALYEGIGTESSLRVSADIRRAVILSELGRTADAQAILDPLMADSALDQKIVNFYASVLAEQGQYGKAIEVLETAMRKWPADSRFLFLKGVYLERSGDVEACIATMREVISKDPENSSAYNYLGYLFVERNENLDEAERLIKKALQIKPDDAYYLDSLGWLYFQKGDYKKALKHLEKADRLAPGEGVILEHMAEAHWMLNEKDKARALFKRAWKGRLEDKERKALQEKMLKYGVEPEPAPAGA